MNNPLDIINFWISGNYRLSQDTIAWIYANMEPLEGLKSTYEAMTYNIDDANDNQLEIIGDLVNLPRLSVSSRGIFWGWPGSSISVRSWGEAPWYGTYPLTLTPISNELYRRAIKLKIIKNTSGGTYESSIFAASQLLQRPVELKRDFTDFSMWFEYDGDIDQETISLINLYDLAIYPPTARFKGYVKRV